MSDKGWIKSYRKSLDNPIICKDGDHFAVWNYLLLMATHKTYDTLFGKERITLQSGQVIVGRKMIAKKFRINESKVQRILKLFENEHQIEQRINKATGRLITIVKWNEYQVIEHHDEQQVNNERTSSEQRVNTKQEHKNINNIKKDIVGQNKYHFKEIIDYLNECSKKNFKHTTSKNQELIKARINEGFTLDDFKKVIENKTANWKGDIKMDQYLRPQTLFGTKFESYLNESKSNQPTNINPFNNKPLSDIEIENLKMIDKLYGRKD